MAPETEHTHQSDRPLHGGTGSAVPHESDEGLRAHAGNLELALNSMAHGLCLYDANGRLKLYNTPYLQMYGLKADDVRLGWSFAEVIGHRKKSGSFTGDPEQFAAEVMKGVAAGQSVERLSELADGRIITVVNSPIAGGGWVATHRDITARIRAERERDQTKNFLDSVISQVPATVMVKHAKTLEYVLINKKAEEYLGLSSSEMIGKTPFDIYPPDRAEQIAAFDRQVIAGEHSGEYYGTPLHSTDKNQQTILTKRQVIYDNYGEPEYLISIIEDVTERAHSAERVAHMARHDSLTGLGNRLQFAEKIDEALIDIGRGGQPFNLLLLDLDHFKNINDSLGHPVGDALLKAVAKKLKPLLAEEDTIVRLSGDEFAIMQMANGDQREAAVALANRIHEAVLEPIKIEDHTLIIGTSIGIAFAPEHGQDADEMVKCADLALYRAKYAGRNQHRFFESSMEKEAHIRRNLELELRNALTENQFELRYQPVVRAQTQEVCSVEALVRWNSPVKGLVAPDRFIALAEETGLIVPLGEWVMHQACRDAATWPETIKVAINLSAVQFSKGDIVGLVSSALDQSGLAPSRLELEITETVLLHKNEDNIALLHALKDLGVAIVLDDFGTGYSSLSYLKMFPFDKIKIDRSFVNELSTRMDCAAIVCAVAGLGRSLNVDTTAEGVETQEQFTLLRAVGVTQIQGFLFGRPMPVADLPFTKAGQHRLEEVAAHDVPSIVSAQVTHLTDNAMDLPRQIA